jgi:hypothetical protein
MNELIKFMNWITLRLTYQTINQVINSNGIIFFFQNYFYLTS